MAVVFRNENNMNNDRPPAIVKVTDENLPNTVFILGSALYVGIDIPASQMWRNLLTCTHSRDCIV